MILSLSPPSAAEFTALYDETGWADFPLSKFESALAGSWIVSTARDSDGARILETLIAEAKARGVNDIQLFAARGRTGFSERNGFIRRPADGPGMDLSDIE